MEFFKKFLKFCIVSSVWLTIFALLASLYYLHDLPRLNDLELKSDKQIIQINYDNNKRITNRGDIYLSEVNFYELPQHLVNAVIAIEDRRFFNHLGIDIFGIMRAFYANQKAGRVVQGGSTITQQLAKLLFLSPKRTIKRKLQEVLLAFQLEKKFTKEQILTFYLNRAYFGSGHYGVAAAAKGYFGKDISRLNLNESAMLAGLLKAPSKYSPKNNKILAEERAHIVLSAMIDAEFLDQDNFSEINRDISYKIDRLQRLYFADYVSLQYQDFVGKEEINSKIISIKTTLNETIQRKLEENLSKFLINNKRKLGKSQIAAVVMSQDGAVMAMAGGKDYQISQFNRAISAKRQSGSAFKTFVYLAALENGVRINHEFEDEEITIGKWSPRNYNDKYLGKVNLIEAFSNSLNSVSVQLAQKVGPEKILSLARKCGVSSAKDKEDLTIALGTSQVSLLELTAAYATIVNDGIPVIPYAISTIQNKYEDILYQRQSSGFDPVISYESIDDIKVLLRQVVESGTGRSANVAPNIYGKTGTTQGYRDAWFVGFDDKYIIGVWIGNDNNSSTNKITGGSLPAIFFGQLISRL